MENQAQKMLFALLLRLFKIYSTTVREFGIPQKTFVKIFTQKNKRLHFPANGQT